MRSPADDPEALDLEGMRLVLDHLPDLAAVYDRHWCWRYVNPPARALLRAQGIEPSTLPGRHFRDVFPDDEHWPQRELVVAAGQPAVFEYTLPGYRTLEVRLLPIPGGVLSLAREITERRELEEELAREVSELDLERRRLRATLDILPVGVWIANAAGEIVATNPAAREIWRGTLPLTQTPAEYHTNYRGWWTATGEPLGPGDWGLAKAVESGQVTRAAEVDIDCFDGSRRTVLNYALPIRDAAQQIIGGVALTVDITERKREERVQQVVGQASAVLGASLDPDSAFLSLGDLCVQMLSDVVLVFELDAEGTFRRRTVRHRNPEQQSLIEPLLREVEGDAAARRARAALVQLGEAMLFEEVTDQVVEELHLSRIEQRVIAELQLVSLMVLPLRVRERAIGTLAVGTVRGGRPPFTEDDLELGKALALRAALAIDNARLYQGAQAASQAKSQFLATMSHELRTPLTAIIGYDELLLNEIWGELTERQRQQLERIRVSAWHLVTIIDQILTFSRAEAGRETVQNEPVNLTQLMRETSDMLESQAAAKGIELRAVAPARAIWLRTDAGKVRQILLNLVGNAVKFTEFGVVLLELEEGSDAIGVAIHDSGPGIPDTELERIFEPFTQVDQSNTRAQGGTGLGLTVSRRLARLLGGEVTVQSRPGEGSIFTLTLPRVQK